MSNIYQKKYEKCMRSLILNSHKISDCIVEENILHQLYQLEDQAAYIKMFENDRIDVSTFIFNTQI